MVIYYGNIVFIKESISFFLYHYSHNFFLKLSLMSLKISTR